MTHQDAGREQQHVAETYSWTHVHSERLRHIGNPLQKDNTVQAPSSQAVGALLCPQAHANQVIRTLDSIGWRQRQVKVAPHNSSSSLLAIALNSAGATAFSSTATAQPLELPAELRVLLEAGELQWVPGMRPGATRAVGEAIKSAGADGDGGRVKDGGSARFTFAELFAGIGGFRVALDALGGKCVFASEIDGDARATYAYNFGRQANTSASARAAVPVAPSVEAVRRLCPELCGDLTQIPEELIPQHDLLFGSFPCQSFSRLGAQQGIRAE